MIDQDFIGLFLDEATETLERFEAICLNLEKGSTPEKINELFRAAHNLKGSAGGVGLVSFAALVHKIEELVNRLKSGELSASSPIIEILLTAQKILANWIECLKNDQNCDLTETEAVQKIISSIDTNMPQKSKGLHLFSEEPPSPPNKEKNFLDLGSILVESGQISQQQIEDAISSQNRKLGEVLIDKGLVSPKAVEAALEKQKLSGYKPEETIRVSLKKLDSIIRLISELSIQQAIIKNAKENDQLNSKSTLDAITITTKVVQDLQSEGMSLRMQPLENLFQRLERVGRDVARELNKVIDINLKGSEVELDKTVVEKMKDPLIHILRNAVDHGIETQQERKDCGKIEKALITIEGIQTASSVSIQISDDGKGLDANKILQIARKKNLIPENYNPKIDEIYQYIFLPTFSTAEKVTSISGRGVGMDVVKKAVDDLGGTIEIKSRPKQGTTFTISLPSAFSILDTIIVRLGLGNYAVPVRDIEEVVDMGAVTVETSTQKSRVMNLRGKFLPVERLDSYLPRIGLSQVNHPSVALVTKYQGTLVAFEVDEVGGQQSVVARKIQEKLAQVPGFSGATILANGEPSMIIHLPQIVNHYLNGVKENV